MFCGPTIFEFCSGYLSKYLSWNDFFIFLFDCYGIFVSQITSLRRESGQILYHSDSNMRVEQYQKITFTSIYLLIIFLSLYLFLYQTESESRVSVLEPFSCLSYWESY